MPSNRNVKLRINRKGRFSLNIFKCDYPECCNFISSINSGSRKKCNMHWKNRHLITKPRGMSAKTQARDRYGKFI